MNRLIKTVILCAVMLAFVIPHSVMAASGQLTATDLSAFEKTASAAEKPISDKMRALLHDLVLLQEEERDWEAKFKAVRYRNEESFIEIRKLIKLIEAEKLNKLENQVKQTRERYQPLFQAYSTLNQQISAARRLKNKELILVLRSQADVMKAAVQLARQDVRSKEAALRAVKAAKAAKVKKIRGILGETETIQVQIKETKNSISMLNKQASPIWSNFKLAVRQNNARSTSDSLSALVSIIRRTVNYTKDIHALEQKISGILVKAKEQF